MKPAPGQAFVLPPSVLDAISLDDPDHVVREVVHAFDMEGIHRAHHAERSPRRQGWVRIQRKRSSVASLCRRGI